jgi:hypothetical protein
MFYPKIPDDDYYEKITKKYSKYTIPKTKKTINEMCYPKSYQFQIPQQFVSEYINPKTPYKSLLVYFGIGAGKSCAAIKIAENFTHIHNMKILIVLPAALKGNFRYELYTPCTGNKYITHKQRERLKKLFPTDKEYTEIINSVNKKIDKHYEIISYNKFINELQNGRKLDNTLLIIDEVHNMISETGIYYKTLFDAITRKTVNFRLVIMTATPIFDKPSEFALILNLLYGKKVVPIGVDFIKSFIKITIDKDGKKYYSVINPDLFKKYVKGYVSYYRGAPAHAYPAYKIKISKCKMSDHQKKLYMKIIKKEMKTVKLNNDLVDEISNSFFIGTRMVSNIAYPNMRIGDSGYDSLSNKVTTKDFVKYSCKMTRSIRQIRKTKGTVFVYSNFKEYGGIKPYIKLLELYGYKNYEDYGPGRKRYAIWSGDQNIDVKNKIKETFNNPLNMDGAMIKIIIGSPSAKEGVSFLRVQLVHVLEPYWNWSRMDQIIGRAIRYCSHKDMDPDRRFVDVRIFIATHPDINMSVDEYILRMAISKQTLNKQFERLIKEAAIDCTLFKNANVEPGENPIICEY